MQTTVFRNGGSQAIRIPAQFRFEGDTVDVEWDESLNALMVRENRVGKWAHFFSICESLPNYQPSGFSPVLEDGRFDVATFMESE